jgi:hypothetical protein
MQQQPYLRWVFRLLTKIARKDSESSLGKLIDPMIPNEMQIAPILQWQETVVKHCMHTKFHSNWRSPHLISWLLWPAARGAATAAVVVRRIRIGRGRPTWHTSNFLPIFFGWMHSARQIKRWRLDSSSSWACKTSSSSNKYPKAVEQNCCLHTITYIADFCQTLAAS